MASNLPATPAIEKIAFDDALGVFSDTQLARRYRIPAVRLKVLQEDEDYKAHKESARHLLTADPREFQAIARAFVAEMMQVLRIIAKEIENPTAVRVRAATNLIMFAGAGAPAPGTAATQNITYVQTNLNLQSPVPGRYSVDTEEPMLDGPSVFEGEIVSDDDVGGLV